MSKLTSTLSAALVIAFAGPAFANYDLFNSQPLVREALAKKEAAEKAQLQALRDKVVVDPLWVASQAPDSIPFVALNISLDNKVQHVHVVSGDKLNAAQCAQFNKTWAAGAPVTKVDSMGYQEALQSPGATVPGQELVLARASLKPDFFITKADLSTGARCFDVGNGAHRAVIRLGPVKQ